MADWQANLIVYKAESAPANWHSVVELRLVHCPKKVNAYQCYFLICRNTDIVFGRDIPQENKYYMKQCILWNLKEP